MATVTVPSGSETFFKWYGIWYGLTPYKAIIIWPLMALYGIYGISPNIFPVLVVLIISNSADVFGALLSPKKLMWHSLYSIYLNLCGRVRDTFT
jgi:hypothetical protein